MTADDVIKLWDLFSAWCNKHALKLLGLSQGTIAAVAIPDGILKPVHLKAALALSSVLTFWKEFFGKDKS